MHLSIIEHGIYRQLMDWQYLDEKPIPKETQVVMRRLSLGFENETQLNNVLSDFFVLTENGYVQSRIFETIADYHKQSKTNRENGKLGGRPRKQGDKTQSVNFANPDETEVKPNQKATNNHKPITNNQEPITKEKKTAPIGFDLFWSAWPASDRKGGKAKCLEIWEKQNLDKQVDDILAHVGRMKSAATWLEHGGKFIPMPSSYLGGKKWDGAELGRPAHAPPASQTRAEKRENFMSELTGNTGKNNANNQPIAHEFIDAEVRIVERIEVPA